MGHHRHRSRQAAHLLRARNGANSWHRLLPVLLGQRVEDAPEILAYRSNGERNSPGWSIRVVPNKFPALGIEGNLNREGEGLYDKMNGIGAHEVIIETPDHNLTLATMPVQRIEDVLWAFRDRV